MATPSNYKYSFAVSNLVGDHHKLKGFGRFEREVNEEFDKMMKSASERLTEMCKIEKRVWNKHEDVINQYDDLITEVDVRTEEQVCSRIIYCIALTYTIVYQLLVFYTTEVYTSKTDIKITYLYHTVT